MLQAERAALVDYLKTLEAADWDRPSLCHGWSVKVLTTHIVSGSMSTPPRFMGDLVSSGFNFEKTSAKGMRRQAGAEPAELVSRLETLTTRM